MSPSSDSGDVRRQEVDSLAVEVASSTVEVLGCSGALDGQSPRQPAVAHGRRVRF
jgi:hypothetical protein